MINVINKRMQTKRHTTIIGERVHWIDVCRGIGIILVMYGHFIPIKQHYLIYAFHMPLFFFLSGLVFKSDTQQSMPLTLKKNVKQLLVPYALFGLLTFIFAAISSSEHNITLEKIGWHLFGVLYGNGNNGMLGFNVELWFLPCLFAVRMLFSLITKYVAQGKIIGLLLLLSGFFGYVLSHFFIWIKLPLGLEIALTGLVFYGAGYYWKQSKTTMLLLQRYQYSIPIAIIGSLITIIAATYNYHNSGLQIDMRGNRLNNIFFFYIGAFSGIVSCLAFSHILKKNKLLEYLGQNSLVLFVWHYLIFVDLRNMTKAITSDWFMKTFKDILPTYYVIATTAIILGGQKLVKRGKGE
jgi:fucose 4-O-acetylase-like acetyltransferase